MLRPSTPTDAPGPSWGVEQFVLEVMREGVIVSAPDGRLVFANRAAEAILGLTREEVAVRTADDERWRCVREDGSDCPVDELPSERTRRTGVPCDREPLGVRRPDGELRRLEVTTALLPGGAGVLSTFADVTEQRAEAEALRVAEERFRRTFDHGPIGKALVDLDGSWLRVNRKLCELLGFTESELLALTFQDITHHDDLEADLGLLRDLVDGERDDYEMEKRYVRRGGSLVWALLSVALVRDEEGEPLHFVSQIQDITERKRFERGLAHLADHDALTGLVNRRRFEADLDAELARVRRTGRPGSVVMLDLDRFKAINDSLGHRVGDRLLVAVARILGERLRRTDVLARLGGDEFALLLPETTVEDAGTLVRDVVVRIAAHAPAVDGGPAVRVTASAGVAPVAVTATSADDVMVAADLAMYEAKHGGGNGFRVRAGDGGDEGGGRPGRARRAPAGDGSRGA